MAIKSFVPEYLTKDAEKSGFFQCLKCGLIWFGETHFKVCPLGHAELVHVVILCRMCDKAVPVQLFAEHLVNTKHNLGEN